MTWVGIAAAGAQPGGAALAEKQGIEVGDIGIGQLAGDAAFGLDIDLGEVVAGTGLQQVKPLTVFAVELPEAEITPRDVAEVPVGASHYEANRHEGVLPAVVVFEPFPVIDATIAVVHERAGTERAPVNEALGDLLGEGPLGEAQGLDRAAGLAEGLGGAGRRAQLDMPHARGGAHQLQQPRLINNVAAFGVPVIEATDHHGIAGQVDHGAGAVELLHLALADLPDRGDAAAWTGLGGRHQLTPPRRRTAGRNSPAGSARPAPHRAGSSWCGSACSPRCHSGGLHPTGCAASRRPSRLARGSSTGT